ncbi:MAG: type II toxin-antitoxin system death-on-curing family toxin [Bryobacteraceae bacterium]|nr:type II toxin-antitoxin system death-on-curing family toxin [Bryobacteraceae bacterium]
MMRWLREKEVRAMHLELIADQGGMPGVRSPELLDSALARAQNLATYGEPTLAELAATYAFGVAKNHPFVDGNKRVALTCAGVFLELNGWQLTASQEDAVVTILALAAGELSEAQLAAWFAQNLEKLPES